MLEKEDLSSYLSLDDDNKVFEVIECSFGFSQGHDFKPSSRTNIDLIHLTIKVEGDTSLIEWMISKDAVKKCTIHLKISENSYREITFSEGWCVSYNERFDIYSGTAMIMNISILVHKIKVEGRGESGKTSQEYDSIAAEE